MNDLLSTLFSYFVVSPAQSALAERLTQAGAPRDVIGKVAACGPKAAELVDRIMTDPWWAISTAIRTWFGTARPDALLLELAPGCASVIDAARPYLSGLVG